MDSLSSKRHTVSGDRDEKHLFAPMTIAGNRIRFVVVPAIFKKDRPARDIATAFGAFMRVLDAVTISHDFGREIPDMPGAIRLSVEVQELFNALGAAERRLWKGSKSIPGQSFIDVAGARIQLTVSNEATGPGEIPPPEHAFVHELKIGAENSVAHAIINRAMIILGYPQDSWRRLQAAKPGGPHQRYRERESFTREQIEVLRSVERLIQLAEHDLLTDSNQKLSSDTDHPLAGIGTLHPSKGLARWRPPPGYVGTKEIGIDNRFKKDGKNPPRTTIDVWLKKHPTTKIPAPDSREIHISETWVLERIAGWNPRSENRT